MQITILRWAAGLLTEERAQDSFEYVLVLGGISVATILAIASPVGGGIIQGVLAGTCGAVGTIVPSVSC